MNHCERLAALDDRGDLLRGRFGAQQKWHRVEVLRRHCRGDVTRADGDHLDAAAAQLDAQAFEIRDRRRLRCRIGCGARQPAVAGDARNSYQSPVSSRPHGGKKWLKSFDDANHVDIDHVLERRQVLGKLG